MKLLLVVSEPLLWNEGEESIGAKEESDRNGYDLQGRYVHHRRRG